MDAPPAEVRSGPVRWTRSLDLAVWAIGPSLVALGALMAVDSTSALFPDQGLARAVPALLVATGLLAFGVPWAYGGRAFVARVGAAVPRGYPFGPAWLQGAIFVVLVLSGAAVVSSLASDYSGALNGGSPTGLADPGAINELYLAASVLLWLFALWGIALLARVLRLGRALDRRRPGTAARARPPGDEEAPVVGLPSPPMTPEGRRAVLLVAIAWGFVASAGIQVLETNLEPISAVGWLATQIFTPAWAGGLGVAALGLDAFLRDLERRYAPVRTAPAPGAALVGDGRGFVP